MGPFGHNEYYIVGLFDITEGGRRRKKTHKDVMDQPKNKK